MEERWIFKPGKADRWSELGLRVAICFPDTYRVGMANLGFLWVFELFNRREEVRCDRFFIANRQLKGKHAVTSPDVAKSLSEYDVVAFSIPYEGAFPFVPVMLEAGGVEPVAAARRNAPLVVAGGMAASANPEPIADFIDAALVGDAEAILPQFIDRCLEKSAARKIPVSELAGIPGVYAPSLYSFYFGRDGTIESIEPMGNAPETVEAAAIENIDEAPRSPVVTDTSAFPGMFLVEAARGCPHRCRFCLAGNVSRKFRIANGLQKAVEQGLAVSKKIGFVGTAFAKSPDLRAACEMVAEAGAKVSFSSIRMEKATVELLEEIGDSLSVESIAIAPEVAAPILMEVIRKDIGAGIELFLEKNPLPHLKKLRLYYLAGVPGETDEHIEAIAEQARSIHKASGLELLISVTPMTPKPFTPMQWARMESVERLKEKRRLLKKRIRDWDSVSLKFEGIAGMETQAILARGDRRLGKILLEAARKGRAEHWNLLRTGTVDTEFYVRREREENELFPWEVISHGTPKQSLRKEYEAAVEAASRAGKK